MSKGAAKVLKVLSWGVIYFIMSMSFSGDMPFWAYFLTIFLCVVSSGLFDSLGKKSDDDDNSNVSPPVEKGNEEKDYVESSTAPSIEDPKSNDTNSVTDEVTTEESANQGIIEDSENEMGQESKLASSLKVLMAKVFPGGKDEIRDEVSKMMKQYKFSSDRDIIEKLFIYESVLFTITPDKSSKRIVEGAMRRPDNAASETEATIVYDYLIKRFVQKNYGKIDDALIENISASYGNVTTKCNSDVIEGAYGRYGWDVTNPIPVRGIPASSLYLDRLRTPDGRKIKWSRFGSFSTSNIKYPIDLYLLEDKDGNKIGDIYISAYQNVISNTAPEGLILE